MKDKVKEQFDKAAKDYDENRCRVICNAGVPTNLNVPVSTPTTNKNFNCPTATQKDRVQTSKFTKNMGFFGEYERLYATGAYEFRLAEEIGMGTELLTPTALTMTVFLHNNDGTSE
jgi:hypothetical protein